MTAGGRLWDIDQMMSARPIIAGADSPPDAELCLRLGITLGSPIRLCLKIDGEPAYRDSNH